MVKVKICGLQTIADVEAVNRAMPDYAGFIFVPGRRRYIEREARRTILLRRYRGAA